MARHRNYRNYAYEDDLSDDVYGHSVEDYDISVSPGTAEQFMFRRSNSRDPNLSAYMVDRCGRVEEEEEEDEDNDEDDPLTSLQDYRRPQLDPISEAKLSSCMDQLQSILGENLHEPTAVSAIVQCNYDVDRALDYIFSQEEKQDQRKNLDPFGTEGSVSCKTILTTNIKPVEGLYNSNSTIGQATNDNSGNVHIVSSDIQIPKSASLSSKQLKTLSQENALESGDKIPCQTSRANCLDQTQGSSRQSLMSAPLSSLIQPGERLSGHNTNSLENTALKDLMSLPISSLSVSETSMSSQLTKQCSPSKLQALSPVSSLSKTGEMSSAKPMSSYQASWSTSLGTLSHSRGSLSCHPASSSSQNLSAASSQDNLLSVPLSSLSLSGATSSNNQSAMLKPLASSNAPLSVPLSSLMQSGGSFPPWSQSVTSSPLNLLKHQEAQMSALSSTTSHSGLETSFGSTLTSHPLATMPQSNQNQLLSVPLSSLSGSVNSPNSPSALLSNTLSLSQLPSQPVASLAWTSHITSETPASSSSVGSSSSNCLSAASKLSEFSSPASLCGSHKNNPFAKLNDTLSEREPILPNNSSETENMKCSAEELENGQIFGEASIVRKAQKYHDQNKRVKVKKKNSSNLAHKGYFSNSVTAKPSLFALTLCYTESMEMSRNKCVVKRVVNKLYELDCLHSSAFNFSTPSPDDIVKEKQRRAFSRKK
ncbi:transcription factor Sp4-like isoform X1 [Acropora millepora]|uniref:transcription factor Sp4-like isoform X1 n=1 Tax=Acropora millepora TaxID=45264 RepID=UPI001CF3B067|nr:transcription factor Sp4-like isoform X1 [Acropora millepora]